LKKSKGEKTMKKLVLTFAAILALAAPAAFAADHGAMDHGSMGHSEHKSAAAHEEVVDGVKATFVIQTMADAMKSMGMAMPKGVKETHHLHVEFKDVKSGKALTEGEVTVKIQGPDKKEVIKELMGMQGHFGADFVMSQKGKYGIMSKFKLKDGKVRNAKFWYPVK
jgi:Ni/Co efflux regulator RcnB